MELCGWREALGRGARLKSRAVLAEISGYGLGLELQVLRFSVVKNTAHWNSLELMGLQLVDSIR